MYIIVHYFFNIAANHLIMNKEEIKKKREKKGLTQDQLAKLIGVTRQTVHNYEKGDVIPDSKIELLKRVLNEVPYSDSEEKEGLIVSEPNYKYDKYLPLIPIDAMAGFGKGEQSFTIYESDKFVIPIFKGADFLISVKGSSMYPRYNSGDIVACKILSLRDIFFQWNKVYVLDTQQGALIKRVKKGSKENMICLHSDNEEYAPFELLFSQITSIAVVIGVLRLE